jgi:hypothetical protein
MQREKRARRIAVDESFPACRLDKRAQVIDLVPGIAGQGVSARPAPPAIVAIEGEVGPEQRHEAEGAEEFDTLAGSSDLERDLSAFARRHIRDAVQPDIMRMRRRIIADADRFPDLALAWYEAAPRRGHRKLRECFEHLRARGLLRLNDPALAAEHLNWLILSIPLNQAMFDAKFVPGAERSDYYADEAVRVFLAAYGVSTLHPSPRARPGISPSTGRAFSGGGPGSSPGRGKG